MLKRRSFWILPLLMLCAAFLTGFSQADLDRLQAGDKNMQGADLTGLPGMTKYVGVDFTGADLSGSRIFVLEWCNFTNARLENCDLSGTKFKDCNFNGASFRGADCENMIIRDSKLVGADFSGIQAPFLIHNSDCRKIDFSNADAPNMQIRLCDLRGASFSGANIQNANLERSTMYRNLKPFVAGQSVDHFDTIKWVKRPAVKDPGIRTKRFDRRKVQPGIDGGIKRID